MPVWQKSIQQQKKGVKVHNIKCDTVENYVKHTAVK